MRHYASTDDGRRFLVELECDNCGKRAKPGSDDLLENWVNCGTYNLTKPNENTRFEYCGDCARMTNGY
jgi:hypothetical protein